jgi:hypothetical protein
LVHGIANASGSAFLLKGSQSPVGDYTKKEELGRRLALVRETFFPLDSMRSENNQHRQIYHRAYLEIEAIKGEISQMLTDVGISELRQKKYFERCYLQIPCLGSYGDYSQIETKVKEGNEWPASVTLVSP